jgi:phage shock protein B
MSLTRATETAHRLEQRVETLERLLDEDAPGWRARVRT